MKILERKSPADTVEASALGRSIASEIQSGRWVIVGYTSPEFDPRPVIVLRSRDSRRPPMVIDFDGDGTKLMPAFWRGYAGGAS